MKGGIFRRLLTGPGDPVIYQQVTTAQLGVWCRIGGRGPAFGVLARTMPSLLILAMRRLGCLGAVDPYLDERSLLHLVSACLGTCLCSN